MRLCDPSVSPTMDRLYVPIFGTTSTLLPAMASEKTSGLYPNTPNSRETVPAKAASLYSSRYFDNPPLATQRINAWSSKSLYFSTLFIPFFKTTSVTSEIGCVRVDVIAVAFFQRLGPPSNVPERRMFPEFSSISRFVSFPQPYSPLRVNSLIVFFRPSCNRIMQLLIRSRFARIETHPQR